MKKKIMFMIPSISGGGAEKVFVTLINNIDKSKFDVTLVSVTNKPIKYEINSNIKVIKFNTKRVRNSPIKIIKIIKSQEPDLVISTLEHLNILLLLLKKLTLIKTKLVIRQTNIKSLSQETNSRFTFLKKIYKYADKIICQSELMKNDFINITKVNKNVVKIFNPVDIEDVLIKSKQPIQDSISSQKVNVFYAGRLDQIKRVNLIIDAFIDFKNKNNNRNCNLYILGDGPERKKLENQVKVHRLSNSVKFLGFQKNPHKWLKHADLFMMASKHEGMPNVLLEVLALNIPVLILKHPGGTKDIIKLLNLNDRFVEKLIIKDEYLQPYKQDIKLQLNTHFGKNKIIKQYEDLFVEVIEKD